MTTRITIACPAILKNDANHLAAALNGGPLGGETFRTPTWTDAHGNLFAVASFLTRLDWEVAGQTPLTRPSWDLGEVVDLDAASRALAAMIFWRSGSAETVSQAVPTALMAIIGLEGPVALTAVGLTALQDACNTMLD